MLENHKKDKKTISPVQAAVAGAVVGAGVAVAGAVALKDEKNRKQVKKVLHEIKGQAQEYMSELNKSVGDKEQIKEKLAEGANRLQDAASKAKKKSEKE